MVRYIADSYVRWPFYMCSSNNKVVVVSSNMEFSSLCIHFSKLPWVAFSFCYVVVRLSKQRSKYWTTYAPRDKDVKSVIRKPFTLIARWTYQWLNYKNFSTSTLGYRLYIFTIFWSPYKRHQLQFIINLLLKYNICGIFIILYYLHFFNFLFLARLVELSILFFVNMNHRFQIFQILNSTIIYISCYYFINNYCIAYYYARCFNSIKHQQNHTYYHILLDFSQSVTFRPKILNVEEYAHFYFALFKWPSVMLFYSKLLNTCMHTNALI